MNCNPIMWDEILEQPSVLEKCMSTNKETLDRLASAMRDKDIRLVSMAARGTSDHAAVYGKYVMESTAGIPVALAASSILTLYGKELRLKNALVIALSQSGMAADALEVIRAGNRQGAITVSITNAPGSPLATEAMFHLFCEAAPERSVAATKSFTAQMMLLASIATEYTGLDTMKRDLAKVPDLLRQTFKNLDGLEQRVERYRFMNECFVLSRGINYAVCLEAALKIQETTYVRAKAFATSDFVHGPIAMVEKDFPIIVFAPEGPSYRDVSEVVQKLKDKQAEIIMVSDMDEMLAQGASSFKIPRTGNDLLSPFLNVAVAQSFACRLSVAKGLNPDAPRGLSKVTITK